MAELMHRGNSRASFSYVDDFGVLGIERTIAESATAAQQGADNLLNWANTNAVKFHPRKTEVILFK